jgi:hypothetical protein
MNAYRSIGGRANASGVERVNRDGGIEVLEMGEAEVTTEDRISWYSKAKISDRGVIPDEIYDTEIDTAGNDMRRNVDFRTSTPRPQEYSTEARLSESRGEKVAFHQATDTDELALGITEGMILSDDDRRSLHKKTKKKKKALTESFDNKKLSMARAFERIAYLTDIGELENSDLVDISSAYNIPVNKVIMLEAIASESTEITKKYADVSRSRRRRRKNRHEKCLPCSKKNDVPGTDEDATGLQKETVEEGGGSLVNTCKEVGLIE